MNEHNKLADHSGDSNEMVADTNPLSVFDKECVLGAYTYDELPDAARLALKRAKKAEPWKCACGANLYINSDGAPTSRLKPVKQEPVAVISESAIGLVKLHSNGACLPFGTQLYTAPVDAKAIREERTKELMQLFLDPENQPTQFGTATLEYRQEEHKAIRAEALEQAEEIAKTIGGSFSVEFLAAIRGLK